MVDLEEFAPGRFRVRRERLSAPVSDLPRPHVISDIMDPLEQVDGRFYTSKRQYRAVGRAHGLTEVGNERPKPRTMRPSQTREQKDRRRASLKKAVEHVRAG